MVTEAIDPIAVGGPVLVESKLRPPRRRAGTLARDELLDRLDAAGPVVVLRAPAGYGKTTLVRQWVERADRPFAWLTLDAGDADPIVLSAHLVAALDRIVPMPAADVALRRGWSRPRLMAAIGADLSDAPPLVLVLDDAQELAGATAADLVDGVLDLLPEGATAVVTTRADPGVRRMRRLLDGSLTELGAPDLRLTPDEAATLLRAARPDLAAELVDAAVARCDGWAAAVALVGLALGAAGDPGAVVSGLSGADRPVAEYLRDEVLAHLTAAEREFLVRTSVLRTLSAGLCDAVLERRDSHDVLEGLVVSGNLFVVGLDDGGASYRYHRLWRQLLLAELRATDADAEPELRRRAARWLESHGDADGAIEQLHAAAEPARAAEVVGRQLGRVVHQGMVATLRRWTDAFGPDDVHADPSLVLARAWLGLLSGAPDEVRRWLTRLDAFAADDRLPDGSTVAIGRAAVELVGGHGGAKRTIGASDVLVAAGPAHNPWWATARVVGTAARYQIGELDDADGALEAAAHDVVGAAGLHALALAHQAFARLRANRASDAHPLAVRARAELADAALEDFAAYAVVAAVGAADAARAGDAVTAAELMHHTIGLLTEARAMAQRGLIHADLLVAETALLLGDTTIARAHLRRAVDALRDEPDVVVLAGHADELQGRLDAIDGSGMVERLTDAELRVLEQLPTHRTLREIAELMYVSRNTVKTQTVAIYRKLGVSNRGDAVVTARALGLLDS